MCLTHFRRLCSGSFCRVLALLWLVSGYLTGGVNSAAAQPAAGSDKGSASQATHPDDLVGVVLNESGAPAPLATVTAAGIFVSPPRRITVVTDDQGRFRISLPKTSGYVSYGLAVRWRNQGCDLTRLPDANGKDVGIKGQLLPPCTIRLRTEGRLRGRLLQGEDDRPISGGRLFLDTGEVLTTDTQGVFDVAGLPMKDHSAICVVPGRARSYVLFDTSKRPEAELNVRLQRGATAKGRVLNEEGQPIDGAYVQYSVSGTALALNGFDEPCRADGSFEFCVSPRRLFYYLTAYAPGYESFDFKIQPTSAADVFDQQIRLKKRPVPTAAATATTAAKEAPAAKPEEPTGVLPRKVVTGVVRGDNGAPVKGARVRWGRYPYDQSVPDVLSDAEGKYQLKNVPQSAGALLFIASEYAPQFVPVAATNEQADVDLTRGLVLQGVVKGSSGAPVAGVQVVPVTHCFETGLSNLIWLTEIGTSTNEKGEFRIAAVPTTGVMFDFLKEGYSEQRGVGLQLDKSQNEITLSAGGAADGIVVDDKGQPVRDFRIRVHFPRNRTREEPVGGYFAGFSSLGITFTRDDGQFVFTDLGAGTWMRLIVTAPGIGQGVIDRVQAVPFDQLTSPPKLTIKLKPFVPISVKVVSAVTDQPVANAVVGLIEDELKGTGAFRWGDDDLSLTRVRTNSLGEARFDEPGADDGTLVVSAPGFAGQRLNWNETERDFKIVLQPGCTLSAQVRLKGKPLAEGYVHLYTKDREGFGSSFVEFPGQFKFDGLPAGPYDLTIYDRNGDKLHSREVTVTTSELRLEPIDVTTEQK